MTVDPGLPPLDGDEDLLHRAVFNLVLNAVQATGADGHVQVHVHRQAARHPAASSAPHGHPGDVLVISVTDDGPGVPADLRDRLFEPFVSGKAGGTGLGLPVVHRAVEAHRGVVLVDTLSAQTRFSILLPLTSSATGVDITGLPAASDAELNVFPVSNRLTGAVR